MKKSIFIRALQKDISIIQALFVVILLLTVGTLFYLTVKEYDASAATIGKSFSARDSLVKVGVFSNIDTSSQVKQLKLQYQIIEQIKASYFYMAFHFNSFGFAFTIFFSVTSVVTAILTFLLLKKGWDNSSNYYLKSSFMVMFFASTFFGIAPNIFNSKENSKNNLTKYNYYSGLQLDIFDLLGDHKGFIKKHTPDSLNSAISAISKGIKDNQDLYFDIYADKVPKDIKLPLGN